MLTLESMTLIFLPFYTLMLNLRNILKRRTSHGIRNGKFSLPICETTTKINPEEWKYFLTQLLLTHKFVVPQFANHIFFVRVIFSVLKRTWVSKTSSQLTSFTSTLLLERFSKFITKTSSRHTSTQTMVSSVPLEKSMLKDILSMDMSKMTFVIKKFDPKTSDKIKTDSKHSSFLSTFP